MTRECLAVLVAGGDGRRLGRSEGKALAPLAGRPLFVYAYETLSSLPGLTALALVLRPVDQPQARAAVAALRQHLCGASISAGPGAVTGQPTLLWVDGGRDRQASVCAGLEALSLAGCGGPETIVLIHDAARPLAPRHLFTSVIESAAGDSHCTVAPVLPASDALRLSSTAGIGPTGAPRALPPRDGLLRVQTPQAGHFASLLAAHRAAAKAGVRYLDDLTAGEAYGLAVRLVDGSPVNIKVTAPADLTMAEALVRSGRLPRTGTGFDVHAAVPGQTVRLGGVDIPAPFRLEGHSDADVVAHAVIDAVLGAAGCGDIGLMFPPSDQQWRGADSLDLLRRAWRRVTAGGFILGNVDVTVLAEAPRLAPHYEAMRANLAQTMSCRPGDVSVKATTTEHLGAIGRGEGIAAMAVATLFGPPPCWAGCEPAGGVV